MSGFFLFSIVETTPVYCQEIRPGEFIIQLRNKSDLENLKQNYAIDSVRSLSKRLKIWKLLIKKNSPTDDFTILENLRNDKRILKAQFNHRLSLRGIIPNDSLFKSQWSLNNEGQSGGTIDADIDAVEAWEITTGGTASTGEKIVVGIIDEGFDLSHNDLNFWKNNSEIPDNGIDDDENGYIDDYNGWNAYEHSGNITPNLHGTHIAGIIGAKGNNVFGMAGVSWGANILPVQGSSSDESTVIESYSYLLEVRINYEKSGGLRGAMVVVTNASFGVDLGKPEDYPLWCSVFDSLGAHGILNVCSTTNSEINVDIDGDIPTTCTSDFMLAVTNTNHFDSLAYAGYGPFSIDLGAPGELIISTFSGNEYGVMSGTSMAGPHVAGAIALLFSSLCPEFFEAYRSNPPLISLQIKNWILDGTDSLSTLNGFTLTNGRLNINNSILLAQTFNCALKPSLNFIGSERIIYETGDSLTDVCRKYSDYSISLRISSPPDSNVNVLTTIGGTALEGIDFTVESDQSFIFLADSTDTLTLVLRIFDNSKVNADKNILCNFEISDTSLAIKNNYNQEFILVVKDDDFIPETELKEAVFTENWSNGNFTFNEWETDSNQIGFSNLSISAGALLFSWQPPILNFNTGIISKPIPVDSFTHFTLEYQLKIDNYDTLNINYFETSYKTSLMSQWILLDSVATIIAGDQGIENLKRKGLLIDSSDGTPLQIRFRFHGPDNSSLNEITVDNIIVYGYHPRFAEKNIFNSSHYFYPADTLLIYSKDGKIVCSVENMGTIEYECTEFSIDREGAGSSPLLSTNPEDFATDKTFLINPAVDDSTGSYRITLYFNRDEVEGWENETGNQRSDIHVLHSGGAINNVTPFNPLANGNTNRLGTSTLQGTFGDVFWVSEIFSGFLKGGYTGIKDMTTNFKNQVMNTDIRIIQDVEKNNLTIMVENSEINSIQLINSIGQNVLTKELSGTIIEIVNLKSLIAGIYFLKIIPATGIQVVKKIVIY
ncbi:MAG: hypothetical protein A3G23_07330 [Bacteroidetes bacterium RIFCSPLOWO2_12_FULL_37_12]|nr:MAG: hypothetical protein A3G23_07330 [Bacteroidetes bacterium RIFCSPLOWO2_12_FULL_37_12]